jgi:hypothetical protein
MRRGVIIFSVSFGLAAGLCPGFGQQPALNEMRLSTSTFSDNQTGRTVGEGGLDWAQPFFNHSLLNASVLTTRTGSSLRGGRSVVEWQNASKGTPTISAKAGTFFFDPIQLQNRSSPLALPPALMRGVRAEFRTGGATFGMFTGNFVVEEGARLLSVRSTAARITGVYMSRGLSPKMLIAIEADDITSGDSANVAGGVAKPSTPVTQLRPSFRWTPFQNVTLRGEYSVTDAGRPSFDISAERESKRLWLNASYVRRGRDYLPFGSLTTFADREGPAATARTHLTAWLDVSGSFSDLAINAGRRTDPPQPSQHARHYEANTATRLPAHTQFNFGIDAFGLSYPHAELWQIRNWATLTNGYRGFATRFRLEDFRGTGGTKSKSIEVEETRAMRNGLSITALIRWQNTVEPGRQTVRVSTTIRGAYNFSKRISLAIQTDLSGEPRNRTPWPTSKQRNTLTTAEISLSPASKLHFEYSSAWQSYGRYAAPAILSTRNTVLVRIQRKLPLR